MKLYLVFLVAVEFLAATCADDLPWWRTAVFYQVYPRSFKDSDGNGVGDLRGIAQMADYFKEIGVDAIWLSPIYTSPMKDFGYDVSDFMDIDPLFGTMADFEALVAKLKSIGVKLVLDLVFNHSSDEHPWFLKSVDNVTNPDYSDFYIWKDPKFDENGTRIPPNNWLSRISGIAWKWNEKRKQYYFHQFVAGQPDLNYRNPYVLGNMTNVVKFWLNKGIDGFRLDAVQYIFENASYPDEPPVPGTAGDNYRTLQHIYEVNQPETHQLVKDWADLVHNLVQKDGQERVMVLEVYDETPNAIKYYGTGNQSLEYPFNFALLSHGNQSTRPPYIKSLIDEWLSLMPKDGVANWAVGNHDRSRVAARYGPEMVDSMCSLTGMLPGVKFVYYGDEIGMTDTYTTYEQTVDPSGKDLGPEHYMDSDDFGTRDPERTPMQWDSSTSAGFSTNRTTWLPVNPNYWWVNVEAQRKAENSHLKVFQALAKAKQDPILQRGDTNVLVPEKDTLVVVRTYNGSHFVLVINMGSESLNYTSQDTFAPYGLDVNMTVVIASINAGYNPGTFFKQGFLNVTLRPKASILLRSAIWTPSPTSTSPSPPQSTSTSSSPTSSTTNSSGSHLFAFFSLMLSSTIILLRL